MNILVHYVGLGALGQSVCAVKPGLMELVLTLLDLGDLLVETAEHVPYVALSLLIHVVPFRGLNETVKQPASPDVQ